MGVRNMIAPMADGPMITATLQAENYRLQNNADDLFWAIIKAITDLEQTGPERNSRAEIAAALRRALEE